MAKYFTAGYLIFRSDIFTALACIIGLITPDIKLAVGAPTLPAVILAAALTWLHQRKVAVKTWKTVELGPLAITTRVMYLKIIQ